LDVGSWNLRVLTVLLHWQVRTISSNVSRINGAAVSDVNGGGMEDVILTFSNGTALAHLNGDQLVGVAVQMRQIVNGSRTSFG
jgi:hypothetical protein